MKEKELIDIWKREESVAHIHGWDFSHIEGRYTEETDLPWNYQNIILDYLKPEMKLLDIDTGGVFVIPPPSLRKNKCNRSLSPKYSAMQRNLAPSRN